MDDTFPDDELLARCNDPTLWQRVKLLADLSNLENAVREVVHLLRQIAHQTPEQHHGAELRIVRAKWDVDEYLGAVGDQARVSRRHIDPVLILAIRTADRLAVGVPIEPPSDDRLDDLLAGVAQDIRDATEALWAAVDQWDGGEWGGNGGR